MIPAVNPEKAKSILGIIIDAPIEEVDKLMKESHYNVTTLTNFKKGLELEYQRVENMKNQILNRVQKGEVDKEQGNTTVQELYIVLQRIEDRATLVQKFIEELKIDFKN